ncbi:MAG TPA: hypothetical protein VGN83_10270 [Falsiroseomonas sp.]|nr:hypothetical protein [Falsiroseomonas sp.]
MPVEKLAESYAKALPGRPSLRASGAISAEHAAAEAAALRNAIASMKLTGRAVAEVTAADLLGLLRLEAACPATARLLFGSFGRFMEWCRDAAHLTINPCDAIPRAQRPKPPPARLLIALPVRRGEGARLAWDDVDLRAGVWTLPGAITKNGEPHRIALHPLARTLLRARHKAMGKPTSGPAFPSPRAGKGISAWTAMKAEMGEAAGFRAWTRHDFRRSFASINAVLAGRPSSHVATRTLKLVRRGLSSLAAAPLAGSRTTLTVRLPAEPPLRGIRRSSRWLLPAGCLPLDLPRRRVRQRPAATHRSFRRSLDSGSEAVTRGTLRAAAS